MGRNSVYSGRELERGKTWQAILYPDADNYSYDDVLKNITSMSYRYAYILHSEDTFTSEDAEDDSKIGLPKKDHVHIVFFWDNSYQLGYIANKIGLPSNYLQRVQSRTGAIQYLTHKNNPEKHQYNVADIVTNIVKLQTKYFSDDDCLMKASKIVEYITSFRGPFTVTAVAQWCIYEACWDEFRRGQHLFTTIISEHNNYYEGAKQ